MSYFYLKEGHKQPTIVLLHGWGMSKNAWKNIIPSLSKDFTVYALDLPGFGDNQQVSSNFTINDYVQYLHNFIQKEKLEKIILLGWSFGSRVAALYTLTYPKNVSKLILYSTSLPTNKIVSYKESKRRSFINFGIILGSVITRSIHNRRVIINDYKELKELHKKSRSEKDFIGKVNKISHPTLLLAGRFDYIALVSNIRSLQKVLPHAQLQLFNRSTHLAHIEERAKFLRVLKEFVNK